MNTQSTSLSVAKFTSFDRAALSFAYALKDLEEVTLAKDKAVERLLSAAKRYEKACRYFHIRAKLVGPAIDAYLKECAEWNSYSIEFSNRLKELVKFGRAAIEGKPTGNRPKPPAELKEVAKPSKLPFFIRYRFNRAAKKVIKYGSLLEQARNDLRELKDKQRGIENAVRKLSAKVGASWDSLIGGILDN